MMSRFALLLVGVAALGVPPRAGHAADGPAPDFDAVVAPVLAKHCLDCHNASDPKGKLDLSRRAGLEKGGENGPPVVAGEPGESLLWERVESGEMPPKGGMPDADRAALRAWIASGAGWGTDPIDPYRATSSRRAGRDWWSLQPVRPVAVPAGEGSPIDRFVAAKRSEQGLSGAPEAGRRSLIRRLSFDLTGLPPAPDEVAAFEADPAPDAYEKLVDRLLASPQYGVRWARWWLDLARFGESHGYEYDEFRPDAWRYRDWVVDALNRDVPYDEFARLQVAGDLIHPDDPASIEATGFLVAGPYDTVGQNQISKPMKAAVRADEVEDIVGTVSQAFLGLSVHCARCHDHKFDPIRQAEYYRVASALGGVRHGVRDLSALDAGLVRAQRAADDLAREVDQIELPVRRRLQAGSEGGAPLGPTPFAAWDFDQGPDDRIGDLDVRPEGGAALTPDGLRLDGREAHAVTGPVPAFLRDRTVEAWVRLDDLDQRGGAVVSLQGIRDGPFDALVYGEQEPNRWMAGSEGFTRTRSFAGPAEADAASRPVHVALVYQGAGTIRAYRDGQPYGVSYRVGRNLGLSEDRWQVAFGIRHFPVGGNRMLRGTIRRARLYDRALDPAEVAASFASGGAYVTDAMVADAVPPDRKGEHARLRADLDRARRAQAGRKVHRAYAVAPREPGPTRVDLRGNPNQPGETVTPGGIAAVSGPGTDLGLPADAPDRDRRTALAGWITAPDNPLFARVIANRLWQAHFGAGLVETPSDLGFNGGTPSHPELLDWLAATIRDGGWSLKKAHRLLVTSQTYRQASRPDPAALAKDGGNRWLWRKAPARLEAEMVRDAMLAVSGRLDAGLGGPSFQDRKIVQAVGTPSLLYEPVDPGAPGLDRRTLFRAWVRGGRSSLLDAFDCPDPSATSPRRASTTTPLQALAMMNNALVLHLGDAFADRLRREAGPDPAAQADRAYRLALGRAPDPDERAEAAGVVAAHGAATLARALFNSGEFAFLD